MGKIHEALVGAMGDISDIKKHLTKATDQERNDVCEENQKRHMLDPSSKCKESFALKKDGDNILLHVIDKGILIQPENFCLDMTENDNMKAEICLKQERPKKFT